MLCFVYFIAVCLKYIVPINCQICVVIWDVCSHGSPLTQRVTHDGKNQISGNQRVSVGRITSPGGPNTDHLLFRFALNLETESAVRPRRRRPAIGDGWVSPLTVLSIHALAPFPQLNNCIHIHSPREIATPFLLPLVSVAISSSLCHSLSSYVSLAVRTEALDVQRTRHRKISPRSNLRSNCSLQAHHVAQRASCKTADTWCLIRSNCAWRAEGIPDDLHAFAMPALRQFFAPSYYGVSHLVKWLRIHDNEQHSIPVEINNYIVFIKWLSRAYKTFKIFSEIICVSAARARRALTSKISSNVLNVLCKIFSSFLCHLRVYRDI